MTDSAARPAFRHGSRSALAVISLGTVCVIALYFVGTRVPPYLQFEEGSYGTYFWPRAYWILPHVLLGAVAALIGPLQLSSAVRKRYPQYHRIAGRVYVIVVGLSSFFAAGLVMRSEVSFTYASGLAGLTLAWLLTTGMAFLAIRSKNLVQHRDWMIRSYVVTFGFIMFRVLDDAAKIVGVPWDTLPAPDRLGFLAWACWAYPLLITEVVLQARYVLRRGTAGRGLPASGGRALGTSAERG